MDGVSDIFRGFPGGTSCTRGHCHGMRSHRLDWVLGLRVYDSVFDVIRRLLPSDEARVEGGEKPVAIAAGPIVDGSHC